MYWSFHSINFLVCIVHRVELFPSLPLLLTAINNKLSHCKCQWVHVNALLETTNSSSPLAEVHRWTLAQGPHFVT